MTLHYSVTDYNFSVERGSVRHERYLVETVYIQALAERPLTPASGCESKTQLLAMVSLCMAYYADV